ncbi:hypothetical protein BC936DRAFT_146676 [Jimgerdemannia flammicorona]|uniref:Uncharacterized protein n=1 Tax=Jimgerdemannia flammicorona TaxID=994334 RepID=A0A433D727_9FUNG|nr:hypothetical protein BC936DRAFT_146676 [Jimgerdemannia flammicorona]
MDEDDCSDIESVFCNSIYTHFLQSYPNSTHEVYLLTMDDGSDGIGRLAFSIFLRLKMESEVATEYHISILVPNVYA